MSRLPRSAAACSVILLALTLGSGCGKPSSKEQGTPAGQAVTEIREAEFFPLTIGTTWHYIVNNSNGKGNGKLAVRVTRHDKIGNNQCAVLEHIVNDKVVNTETLGFKDDGLYYYWPFEPPQQECLLKLPFKKGERWQSQSKPADFVVTTTHTALEDTVKVPAGEYQAIKVEGKSSGGDYALDYQVWYAKGVGIIKRSGQVSRNPTGPHEFTVELEKVEKGK